MTLFQPLSSMILLMPSLADDRALAQFTANLDALLAIQPRLRTELLNMNCDVSWIFGRDGSLTCKDETGAWWAGCSLPSRAGAAMLRNLEVPGVVGCLLAPSHAGEITAALDKLQPIQAIIVIQPDLRSLWIAMHCGEFATHLAGHRLWFAWGEQWENELRTLLDEQPGLPMPERFIRTPALPEELGSKLIPAAEAVINSTSARRTARLQELRTRQFAARETAPVCLIARSFFRLWDDASPTLAAALKSNGASRVIRIDPDNPAETSSLLLAISTHSARALVTTDLCRSHLPGVVPPACPIISWITTPAVPPADAREPDDAIVLADAAWVSAAIDAGWPASRVTVAGWPRYMAGHASIKSSHSTAGTAIGAGGISLIVNTHSLETPKASLDLSSHHLLWEMIREELLSDPFVLGPDAGKYLETRRARSGIGEEGFAAGTFIEQLVLPAYQQGLARTLINARLPLRLHGTGWNELDEFQPAWAGAVDTRHALEQAVAQASVLVYPFPLRAAHQIDTFGKAVVTPGRRSALFLRDVRSALSAAAAPVPATSPISADVMERLL